MGFASGSVSFRRLAVVSGETFGPSEELLDLLRNNALKVGDIGVPQEVDYGWSGGRHLFDGTFSFEHNVFSDSVLFALRIDTNKAPGELKKAYEALEEEAALAESPSGFLSKAKKKDIKDAVGRKLDDELREGRHRRSKLVPVLWNTAGAVVYSPATGQSLEKLRELFERTFSAELLPLTAGAVALRQLETLGKRRDYEDFKPTRFVLGPEGEGQPAEYPWVAKGPEPKEFLGNEFLLWLWQESESGNGTIELPDKTDATVMIDRSLDLDCAFGQTGRDSLRGDGPTRMPEARDALRSGKVPRKVGLILDTSGQQFALTFGAEGFAVSSAKLPDNPDANADTATNPRELLEVRFDQIQTLASTLDQLYGKFLKARCSSGWEAWCGNFRKWLANSPKAGKVEVQLHTQSRRPDREPVEQ